MAYFTYEDPDIISVGIVLLLIYTIFSQIKSIKRGDKKAEEDLPADRYCVQIYGDMMKTKVYTQQFVRTIDEGISWMKKQKISDKKWDIFDTYTGKIVRETKK
jgi:hypothetical protein